MIDFLRCCANLNSASGFWTVEKYVGWIPTVGVWYHIVVTRLNGVLQFYVNGNTLGTGTSTTANTEGGTTKDLFIFRSFSPLLSLVGQIAKVQIYKGIGLDSTAITALYNAGKGLPLNYKNSIDNYNSTTKLLSPWPSARYPSLLLT